MKMQVRRCAAAMLASIMLILPLYGQAMDETDAVYGQVSRYAGNPDAWAITADILDASYAYGVDPVFAAAVFTVESHFDQQAVSSAGAVGIAQLLPGTAAELGVDPYDEQGNIYGGVAYLAALLERYSQWDQPAVYAAAAYNAGPGAVDAAGGVPGYRETVDYVGKVLSEWRAIIFRAEGEEEDPAYTRKESGILSSSEKKPDTHMIPPPIRIWPPAAETANTGTGTIAVWKGETENGEGRKNAQK